MGKLSLKVFSNDPPDDRSTQLGGILFAVIGLVLLTRALVHLAAQPWDLADAHTEVTWAVGAGERDPFYGDSYVIEVGGQRHTCYRGGAKYPADTAPIVYDVGDPSRCRGADMVEPPAPYERINALFGLAFSLIGVAFALTWLAEPRPVYARDNPPTLLRPKVMWVARGVGVLGVLVTLFMSWVHTGTSGFGTPPPSRDTDPDDSDGDDPSGDETPSAKAVPREPTRLTPVDAKEVIGDDWATSKPRLTKLPVRGKSVWVGDPRPIGPGLVVSTGPRYFGKGEAHHWVNVETEKALARFDDEGLTAPAAGVITTFIDHEPVIVHADDGQIVRPEVSLPGDVEADRVRIVAGSRQPVVWVFAEAAGRTYHGVWRDPRTPEVPLTETLPWWPALADGDFAIDIRDHELAAEGCWRYRLSRGRAPECVGQPNQMVTIAHALDPVLAGPWRTPDSWRATIVDARTGDTYHPIPDCEDDTELARWPDPPRVLAVCTPDGGRTTLGLWTPERTWTLESPAPFDRGVHRGIVDYPVVGLEGFTGFGARFSHYLDLVTGRLVVASSTRPVLHADTFGMHRKVVVQRDDRPEQELWVLDTKAATLERIDADIGCSDVVMQTDQIGDRVVIACNKSPMSPGSTRLRGYLWTEVIDLASRRRWRTKGAFEARLTDGGIAVGVTRKRPAQLIRIDTE